MSKSKTKKTVKPTKDIFPFEPNETVKQAFRQDAKVKAAIEAMTKVIATVAVELQVDPWEVLAKEHPEVVGREPGRRYRYECVNGMITRE